ncbi:MAG: nucleotide exchange factor GrpE [Deltaproteobacteria bacterium]|jgi:molecular chaperone GrpE|nr:nucleotide exchange factor GrpE [Deltaproteobacteria bacterium]
MDDIYRTDGREDWDAPEGGGREGESRGGAAGGGWDAQDGGDAPPSWDDAPGPDGGPAGDGAEGGAPDQVEAPAEFTDWEEQAGIYREKYLREVAESQNLRKRHQKEVETARKYSAEPILHDLIPVLENLHLALGYADPSVPAVKGLADGVSLTIKDCLSKLAEHGFRELVCAPGDAFDPNFQEAMGVEPSESLPDNAVARMLARGYQLHDRLLRPVKVMLVKNPPRQ